MGNGLFRLLTAFRLSDTSEIPLWQELWEFWKAKYFTMDLTGYENLDFGGARLVSLPQIIVAFIIGILIASFAAIFNKRVLGDFVRVLLQHECHSVENAKTLEELGYLKNTTIRSALRRGVSLRRVVHCVEEEAFERELAEQREAYEKSRASNPSLPAFVEPVFKMDVSTAHFYIHQEDIYMADIKFEKKGTNWFTFGLVVVACIALLFLAFYLLPDIFQYLDNFIGIFKGAGGNGNILT